MLLEGPCLHTGWIMGFYFQQQQRQQFAVTLSPFFSSASSPSLSRSGRSKHYVDSCSNDHMPNQGPTITNWEVYRLVIIWFSTSVRKSWTQLPSGGEEGSFGGTSSEAMAFWETSVSTLLLGIHIMQQMAGRFVQQYAVKQTALEVDCCAPRYQRCHMLCINVIPTELRGVSRTGTFSRLFPPNVVYRYASLVVVSTGTRVCVRGVPHIVEYYLIVWDVAISGSLSWGHRIPHRSDLLTN
ncbi:hypothetical protein HD554DRAFT_1819334 [Boletus coccyginus]|nr:hypothetical protein HD554DRAFT_1819334 [Boletus coccyginus]